MKQNNNAERLLSPLEHDLTRDELDTLSLDRLEHLDMMMDAWQPIIEFRIQWAKEKAASAAMEATR